MFNIFKIYKKNFITYIVLGISVLVYLLGTQIMLSKFITARVVALKGYSSKDFYNGEFYRYINDVNGMKAGADIIEEKDDYTTYRANIKYGIFSSSKKFTLYKVNNKEKVEQVTNKVKEFIKENKSINERNVDDIINEVYEINYGGNMYDDYSSFININEKDKQIYVTIEEKFPDKHYNRYTKKLIHKYIDAFTIDYKGIN